MTKYVLDFTWPKQNELPTIGGRTLAQVGRGFNNIAPEGVAPLVGDILSQLAAPNNEVTLRLRPHLVNDMPVFDVEVVGMADCMPEVHSFPAPEMTAYLEAFLEHNPDMPSALLRCHSAGGFVESFGGPDLSLMDS